MTERETGISPLSTQQLKRLLITYEIPTDKWGVGEAKTMQHLLDEVANGGCQLTDRDGQLLRQVEVASLNVYYKDKEEEYKLVEDRQVFKDGRTRRRGLGWSVSEKMTPHEDSLDAANRAIFEELGVSGQLNIREEGIVVDKKVSPSYPGLTSKYKRHHFSVVLNEKQFSSVGYVEEQPDKSTYFIWEKQ